MGLRDLFLRMRPRDGADVVRQEAEVVAQRVRRHADAGEEGANVMRPQNRRVELNLDSRQAVATCEQ